MFLGAQSSAGDAWLELILRRTESHAAVREIEEKQDGRCGTNLIRPSNISRAGVSQPSSAVVGLQCRFSCILSGFFFQGELYQAGVQPPQQRTVGADI